MTIPAQATDRKFLGVIVPSTLAEALKSTAQAKGVTASDVTRQALTWYLSASNPSAKAQTKEV